MSDNVPTYGSLPVEIDPVAWFGRRYTPPSPMDVGAIQDQIAGQLRSFLAKANLASIGVYEFPNYDLDKWWASKSIAFLLVAYSSTRLGQPINSTAMLQERTIEFEIHILARTTAWALLGPGSVFALNDAVEAALTGFRPTGCRNAYFTDERYTQQDPEGKVWDYRMTLNVVTLRPQQAPEMLLANLKQITDLVSTFAGAVTATMTIAQDGTLTLPPNTIVVSVMAPATEAAPGGVPARLDRDYNFAAVVGTFSIVPSGILAPDMTVQITTAPVLDTVTAP